MMIRFILVLLVVLANAYAAYSSGKSIGRLEGYQEGLEEAVQTYEEALQEYREAME